MELEGKIALVTGAGGGGPGGQGKGIALTLAKAGADIAVNDIDQKAAEKTVADIKAMGRRATAVVADVTDDKAVNAMVDRIVNQWGGIDILVNNVGLGLPILVEDLNIIERIPGDQSLVSSGHNLTAVGYLTGIERVMQDTSD